MKPEEFPKSVFWSSNFATWQILSEDVRSATFIDVWDCLRQLKVFKEKFPDEHFRVQCTIRHDSASVNDLLEVLEQHERDTDPIQELAGQAQELRMGYE
ncbi:MAG: hypothetical protein AAF959_11085 [Cyanobacteria bacterium P01_D01_bin.56]